MAVPGMAPIPTGRYEGPKTDNAINVRVSPQGVNYLNANWKTLLDTFAPGQVINFPIPCAYVDPPGISPLAVADQGNCSTQSCGRLDGVCNSKDDPVNVALAIAGFQLVPRAPDALEGTITASIDTGKIYVSTCSDLGYSTECNGTNWCFGGHLRCGVRFNTAAANTSSNTVKARIKFTIDTRWDKLLAFSVTSVDGTKICGADGSGQPAPPGCLDSLDLSFSGEDPNSICDNTYCNGADLDFVKTFILQQISPLLQSQVQNAIAAQSCEACGSGKPACPQLPGAASTCQQNVCVDNVTGKCVPRFLGIEGRLMPGALLGNFGVSMESQLDVSVAAGSSVSVDQGINLGTRAGVKALQTAECVPTLPAPQMGLVEAPNFDAEATPGSPYHVGLGISKPFLDLTMHQAHQSGALCMNMSSASVGLLNTGLFKTFLPSLGRLATRDGKDAPMMVVLRPAQVPQISVGEGTFDPTTKKPIKPLLTLAMPDLSVDFYAMLDDRFVRLFSLTADVNIPLSLIFEGCSSVQPALGDLKQLVTNIRTANSEILAEDPKVLADLIPAVIGLAEPALAGALKPFELPAMGGFKLRVSETKGLSLIPGTDTFNHLGVYAELMPASAMCATVAPATSAALARSFIPGPEQMKLQGQALPWPVAVLDVSAVGAKGTAEFAWRVDGGLWSTFLAPNAQGQLEVSHPVFLLQGRHVIEVRSRMAEQPHGVSAPVAVDFLVDWSAPEIALTADREAGVLKVSARDVITPTGRLQFAYRVGEGALSSFGPERVVDLEAVEAAGGLELQVRDEAGNVGVAFWRVPKTAERPEPGVSAVLEESGGSRVQRRWRRARALGAGGGSGVPVASSSYPALALALLLPLGAAAQVRLDHRGVGGAAHRHRAGGPGGGERYGPRRRGARAGRSRRDDRRRLRRQRADGLCPGRPRRAGGQLGGDRRLPRLLRRGRVEDLLRPRGRGALHPRLHHRAAGRVRRAVRAGLAGRPLPRRRRPALGWEWLPLLRRADRRTSSSARTCWSSALFLIRYSAVRSCVHL